jgi:hypothetical protein
MRKKAYRPGSSSTPGYPRLVDVNRRFVLDWGLVVVGGLWLGNAGCDHTPLVGAAEAKGAEKAAGSSKEIGMRGKMAPPRLRDAGVADAKAPKASKATNSEVREDLQPPGEPPMPRFVDLPKPPGPVQEKKVAAPMTEKSTKEVTKTVALGRTALPRLEDGNKAEKKPRKKAHKADRAQK